MASTVSFIGTVKNGTARLGGSNGISDSRSAPASTVSLYVAGVNGGRIDNISIRNCGASTNIANVIRFFIKKNTTYYLLREVNVTSATPTSAVGGYNIDLTSLNWVLEADAELHVTLHSAGNAANDIYDIITVFGGDY